MARVYSLKKYVAVVQIIDTATVVVSPFALLNFKTSAEGNASAFPDPVREYARAPKTAPMAHPVMIVAPDSARPAIPPVIVAPDI